MKTIIPLIEKANKTLELLQTLDMTVINAVLHDMADALIEHQDIILKLNTQDVKNGQAMLLSPIALDRLELDPDRLAKLTRTLREFAHMKRPPLISTDQLSEISSPSVLALIYESRPYLTAISAGLALKTRHAFILRGGKEAFHTNTAISSILCDTLEQNGLPREIISLIPTSDRVSMTELIGLSDMIDFVITYGSEGLI
jgi:glutamate-5-semialdehyde dehydrogenase